MLEAEDAFAAAVAAAIGERPIAITAIRRTPIDYDAFQAGRLVTRLAGRARTHAGEVGWSMIEKVTEAPGRASAYVRDNGQREAAAYGSAFLSDLAPRLRAPTAYGIRAIDDGPITLWLEDMGEPAIDRWTDARLLTGARALGRMGGRWLGHVPDHPWLFRGWIDRHAQADAVGPAIARLRAVRDPRARAEQTGWSVEDTIRLIELQPAIAERLAVLPATLCHHDAVAANVVIGDDRAEPTTTLIDWEMVGPGPLGADLVSFLFASARRGEIAAATVPRLLDPAIGAYIDGAREMGADVDEPALRHVVDLGIVLRWTLALDLLLAADEGRPVVRGSAPGESPAAAFAELVALGGVLAAAVGRIGAGG